MFEQYPAATVVVLAYRSADTIVAVLQGLAAQDIGEPFQIVVVASGGDATADIVRRVFPDVELFATDHRLTPGAGRNMGVAVARSDIVAFLADDCVPAPDWLRRRVVEHRGGHQLVSGFIDTIEPTSWAGCAQYFAKFWGLQGLRDVRIVGRGPLFHLSYDRTLLSTPFDEDCIAGEDTVFNEALVRDGHRVLFDGAIRVSHVNEMRFRDVLAGQREQGLATGEAAATDSTRTTFRRRAAVPGCRSCSGHARYARSPCFVTRCCFGSCSSRLCWSLRSRYADTRFGAAFAGPTGCRHHERQLATSAGLRPSSPSRSTSR